MGEIRDRSFEQQRDRASGLNLRTAAIIFWNTVYLDHAISTTGHPVDDPLLQYLAPPGWVTYQPHRRLHLAPRHPQTRPLRQPGHP